MGTGIWSQVVLLQSFALLKSYSTLSLNMRLLGRGEPRMTAKFMREKKVEAERATVYGTWLHCLLHLLITSAPCFQCQKQIFQYIFSLYILVFSSMVLVIQQVPSLDLSLSVLSFRTWHIQPLPRVFIDNGLLPLLGWKYPRHLIHLRWTAARTHCVLNKN